MQDFLSTVILLFIVIDPVGLAPMIQGMLKKYSPAQQKAILMRELVFALSLLLLFFFSGKFLLDLLGLEPSTLNISGRWAWSFPPRTCSLPPDARPDRTNLSSFPSPCP